MKCPHEKFLANVAVNRLTDSGRFSADVTIKCEQCGEPFRFLGLPAGLDLNGAAVSVDGTQARLAIGTDETVANILDGNCPVGFTVRRGGSQTRRIHVIPIGDVELHAAQDTCWCHPTQTEPNLWVHNAKDCREAKERATGQKSSEGWINIAEFIQ